MKLQSVSSHQDDSSSLDGKVCCKCGLNKPLGQFYRHPATKDHLDARCKSCKNMLQKLADQRDKPGRRAIYRRFYWKNRDRLIVARRNYVHSNGKKITEYRRRKHSERPEQEIARQVVHNAIRSGKLVQQPCEVCGSTVRVQAHHEDYSKPLVVNWLCHVHHCRVHRRDRVS